MTADKRVAIRYRRLPDRLRIYRQKVVLERDDVVVTLSEPLELDEPMTFRNQVMLEGDSLAVWFTFPGAWHDIGRFHRADGSFTGLYANVITPIPATEIRDEVWDTTDLFLDVWWPRRGEPEVLDEDELDEAMEDGAIDASLARKARDEASRIMSRADAGDWPPTVVREWTLARCLEKLGA
ncbi:MAG: DUF402 domain-containing protein [Longimicrobiales bacterium]|nr:DUF402 domain-containing protein [Longimicrobiales bacterium]